MKNEIIWKMLRGRVTKAYCPVTVSSSTDVPDDVEASAAAQYGDSRAYTATEYMEAAGGPAIKITGAGENMLSHPVKSQYLCNNTSDPLLRCRKFDCSVSGRSEHIESDGYYAPGTLDVKSDTDPDGHRTLTFTDWRGLTIMQRRVLDSTTFADTYFFYDVRGQLRMVIQPEGVKNMPEWLDWSSDFPVIKKYGFIYRYDRRGNCTDVRDPGGGWTETRYDRYNRPALRRTPSMAADSVAEFILYDAAGRETLRGLTGSWLASVETVFDATCSFTACGSGIAGSGYEVSDSAMMSLLSGARIINASYYDTYTAGDTEEFSALRSRGFTPDSVTSKGMLTARVTAVFGESGPADPVSWRRSLYGYDREGNCIREISDGSIAGSVLDTERGFTAQGYLTSEDVRVCAGDSVYTLVNRSYYSPKGAVRKQMASYSVSGASDQETGTWSMPYNAPACRTEYDPLGRVRKRISEIAAGMVSGCGVSVATSYTWNLRGQLTGVTSPAFSQTLNYDSGSNPLYNGNIGSMTLSYGGEAVTRSYSYDGLNRLAGSTSGDGFNTSYSYDLNSNPLGIERYGLTTVGVTGIVDDITMSYDGNRLSGGYDSAEEVLLENSSDMPPGEFSCEYDAEGRLIADSSRGISGITYSYSGMPLEITLDNGSIFRYRYTADDVRVRETYDGVTSIGGKLPVHDITRRRYFLGPMEFKSDGLFGSELEPDPGIILPDPIRPVRSGEDGQAVPVSSAEFSATGTERDRSCTIERISLPWGYLDRHGARYTYINDHQGNVRAVVDQNGVAVQTTDYYPYGLPMATSTNPDVNRRKHTGKEYESRGGLNSYDFTARQYNPVTLRMDRIDPFSGKYHGFSPYVFCAANPINRTDPSGMRDFYVAGTNLQHHVNDDVHEVIELSQENYMMLFEEGLSDEDYNAIVKSGTVNPDVFPTINNVLEGMEFVKYKKGVECIVAAKEQNNVTTVEGGENRIDYETTNGPGDQHKVTSYIINELKEGHSVVAGVQTDRNQNNFNSLTGHFLNICASGFVMKDGNPVNFLGYYDNATSSPIKGTDMSGNRLYQNFVNGSSRYISEKIYSRFGGTKKFNYILTEIRQNR